MPTSSNLKTRIIKEAIKVASSSPSQKRVGAILLLKKKIISYSCNFDQRTHPIQYRLANETARVHGNDYSKKLYLHAEIGALIKAKTKADTIVICRIGGHSGTELRNARPCKICSGFILNSGIKHIHYSTNDNGFQYEYWG